MPPVHEPSLLNRFFVFSVAIHLAVLATVNHYVFGGYEAALRDAMPRPAQITVTIVSPGRLATVHTQPEPPTHSDMPSPPVPAQPSAPSPETGMASASSAALQDYVPHGQLTQLPVPLQDVDLNIAPFNTGGAPMKLELTLFIDAHGTVNAVTHDQDASLRQFAQSIEDQFRKIRFSPGEIDGEKVRTRITIVVVSEPVQNPSPTGP